MIFLKDVRVGCPAINLTIMHIKGLEIDFCPSVGKSTLLANLCLNFLISLLATTRNGRHEATNVIAFLPLEHLCHLHGPSQLGGGSHLHKVHSRGKNPIRPNLHSLQRLRILGTLRLDHHRTIHNHSLKESVVDAIHSLSILVNLLTKPSHSMIKSIANSIQKHGEGIIETLIAGLTGAKKLG